MYKIIIIDDDPNIQEILKGLIESKIKNCETILFDNSINMLDFLESHTDTDLLLMDYQLPGLNGIEATKLIRNNDNLPYIPIIIMTGILTDPNLEIKAIENGANLFLKKPFSTTEVIVGIKSMLYLRTTNKQLAFERDILENKLTNMSDKLNETSELHNLMLELTTDGFWQWNLETNEVSLSPNFLKQLDFHIDKELTGIDKIKSLINPKELNNFNKLLTNFLDNKMEKFIFETQVKKNDDSPKWFSLKALSLKNSKNIPYYVIGSLQNITERKIMEIKLRKLALHDNLTNLPNRILLEERFNQILQHAYRYNYFIAVLFVDIDDFKKVNDSYGHEIGDLVLIEFATRLSNAIRDVDTAARYSGDEFILLLADLTDINQISLITKRIREELKNNYILNDVNLNITFSIGISIYPFMGEKLAKLINKADIAMYNAKKSGKDQISFHYEANDIINYSE